MAYVALISVAMDIFLLITYFGIFIYLIRIYRMWQENSIGFWGLGALFVSISISFHLITIGFIGSIQPASILYFYNLAVTFSFLGFWAFGVSHMIARRSLIDVLVMSLISMSIGSLFYSIWRGDSPLNYSDGQFVEDSTPNSLYQTSLLFFLIILYFVLVRDSYIIYKASVVSEENTYRRSIAITHLLAWQFWGIGTIITKIVNSDPDNFIFILPFIFLLVPIITLGSRPFDWAREGYEPVLLLLIDEYGIPAFSWTLDSSSPLLMEGASIATIRTMLGDITKESVSNMYVNYERSKTLYLQSSNGYLSLLITTGYHKSFMKLLINIHQVLVTSIVKPSEFGVPSYEIPNELEWLLSQLLPDKQYSFSNKKKSWKDFFTFDKLNDLKVK